MSGGGPEKGVRESMQETMPRSGTAEIPRRTAGRDGRLADQWSVPLGEIEEAITYELEET